MARLSRAFYSRPAETVARALLGKRMVLGDRSGLVVETEAYVGAHDLACHAKSGKTPRNQVLWAKGGTTYVYLIYGIHNLFNVVTGKAGHPEAVLIRALEPDLGLEPDPKVARGPGKLSSALGITRRHDGLDLCEDALLYFEPGRRVAAADIERGPRVGVEYAKEWAEAPLRFWLRHHPAVSRPPRGHASPSRLSRAAAAPRRKRSQEPPWPR